MRKRWTDNEDLYIKNNYGFESIKNTSNYLNRTERSVKARASKLKVPFNRAKFEHNKDFFYFLGFIAADGNLYHKKGHGYKISSTIHMKDGYLLDYFQSIYGGRSFEIKGYYRFELYSKPLYEELQKFGLTERKSKTLRINWDQIPEEYFWVFVRGYFDGDGSAVKYSRSNPHGYSLIEFCSASEDFLKNLGDNIQERLNLNSPKLYFSKKANANYLKYNKTESIIISKYLKYDKTCLSRKSKRLDTNICITLASKKL